MKKQGLKIKEIITVVLLSLINIVIFGFGTFFYLTPITVLLMPVFYALFQGIVFFMIGVKVQKPGAIMIYCVIQGLVGFNLPYIAMFLLAGVIGELILWKTGYANQKGLTASYVVMQLLACFGSTIYPYAITLDKTLANIKNSGDLGVNVKAAGEMIQSWGCAVLVAVMIIASLLGALMGIGVMKKHILKAKKAAEEEQAEAAAESEGNEEA